jgi:hypothetical protein
LPEFARLIQLLPAGESLFQTLGFRGNLSSGDIALSTAQEQLEPPKSTFVTVVAWIFIILAGFSTFISMLQNIMIQTMLSTTEMHRAMEMSNQDRNIPLVAQFMFNNIRLFFAAFLVVSASTFVSSVGLLKRKNWARLAFIGIMALGILWNIGGFVMQLAMFSSMPQIPSGAPDEFQSRFNAMFIVMAVFSAIMAIGFSVLFGWIIKRLVSPEIKREFGAGA